MIRFRNPGTQYSTQIQVFRELFKEYKDAPSFGLDDMANTIAKTKLLTAYGYAGDAALALSNNENDSLNSAKMNAKMYAEVFRLLGWIASAGKTSYPLVFTYIGEHVAAADDVLPLYEQCVLGINNPQELMEVKYTEKLRFFKAALFSLFDLGGIMYKHELCLGPMCIDDLDASQYATMLERIRQLRGSYSRLVTAYHALCSDLDVKLCLPDNSTRLPIAFMKACGWIESERSKKLYPPKSLECIRLTRHGIDMVNRLIDVKDLRLDEYYRCNELERAALIRLGIYSMLKRAGYDTTPVNEMLSKDRKTCQAILAGKELLFSPYQTLNRDTVDKALGITRISTGKANKAISCPSLPRSQNTTRNISVQTGVQEINSDPEVAKFLKDVRELNNGGMNVSQIVNRIFNESITATQTRFYPFVAMLFRVLGFDCTASRPGDNGSRWDAIIVDDNESIPIEIKSPTEEQHISLKAVRQALENKIILISRKPYPTAKETTSLVVGYCLPNDRAEVSNLLNDFKMVYGFSIGIIDLKTLLTIAIKIILDNKRVNVQQLQRLEGFASVDFNQS